MSISMDFIAGDWWKWPAASPRSLLVAVFSWWSALLLAGAWIATHWLLRESAVWRDRNDDEVREAQRHADYAYRLAVDPPAAKELRLFGLGRLDGGAFPFAPPATARLALAGDAPARASGVGACCWCCARTSLCSGRWQAAALDGHLTLARAGDFCERGRWAQA